MGYFETTQKIFIISMLSLFVVLCLGLRDSHLSFKRYFELRMAENNLVKRVNTLKNEASLLKDEIAKIKGSSDYAKKILIEKYNFEEEGDTLLFLK